MACNPVLVETIRGEILESFHRGAICVVDSIGNIYFSAGDPHQMTYPRSALKFFQQIPLVESGALEKYGITDQELAVMCGSHNGEEVHVNAVKSILNKIGLDKSYLQCGPQYPTLSEDRQAFYKNDRSPEDIHNNCSGKHAGFLTLCRFWDMPVTNYLDYEHPVQKWVKEVIAAMHEISSERLKAGRDGCSAPIYGMSRFQQAMGYKNLINPYENPHHKACKRLISVIQNYPHMLAGKKRYCTELMRSAGNKVIGKTGAEGIFSMAFPQKGWGVTIKIDDGKMGPQYAVAQKLLNHLLGEKDIIKELDSYAEKPLKNLNKWHVGTVRANDAIFQKLASGNVSS